MVSEDSNLIQRFDRWLGADVKPQRGVVTYASLAIFFVFLLLPIIWLIMSTFQTRAGLYSQQIIPNPNHFTLKNYANVISNPTFQQYAINSVIVSVSTTTITLVIGALAAYSLSRFDYPGRDGVLVTFIATQMLPRVLILIPFFTILFSLDLINTLYGLILAHSAFALPFCIWLLKGYFDNIPMALDDAARMDGCSHLQVLRYVMLPLSIPGLAVSGFYTFVLSWNDFLAVSVIIQTNAKATLPLGLELFRSAGRGVSWGSLLAAATITMLPVMILYALLQKQIAEGLAGGGMKGG